MKIVEEAIDTCKILYIEDNPSDTRLVEELLQGFEVISRERLTDGLNYLETNSVDVILLDLALPDSVGYNTFEKVKSIDLNIPVIIITGSPLQRESLRQCISSADNYLVKGEIDSSSLIKVINEAIQKTNITKGSINVNACICSSIKGYTKDRFESIWNPT